MRFAAAQLTPLIVVQATFLTTAKGLMHGTQIVGPQVGAAAQVGAGAQVGAAGAQGATQS